LYKGAKRHPTLGKDVVIGAGAKVLGGFTVGDGAKVGSNAVVTKPVPQGATAVGNPARIIQEDADVQREATASKMGFSAYGVTQNDDPLSQAMRGLIDNAASQEHQITMLWQALEKMNSDAGNAAAIQMPGDAAKRETFEAEKLNQLVGK
jgi:serine O-acetyltransferase